MAILHSHRVSSGSEKLVCAGERFVNASVWPDWRPRAWQLEGGQGVGRLRESVSLRLSSEIKPIMMLLL